MAARDAYPQVCCNPCVLPALARVTGYTPDLFDTVGGPTANDPGTGSDSLTDILFRTSDTTWQSEAFLAACDQFILVYDGSGTISAPNINATVPYTVTGSINGSGNIIIDGVFSSPGNGTYNVELTGVIEGSSTAPGVISGGVITSPATLSITTPTDVTISTQNPSFAITGPTTFDFSGNIIGSLDARVYYMLSYTNLLPSGLDLQLKLAADDSMIAQWINHIEGWRPFCPIRLFLNNLSPTYCPDGIDCQICLHPNIPSYGCPDCDEQVYATMSAWPGLMGYSGRHLNSDSFFNSCVWSAANPYVPANQISPSDGVPIAALYPGYTGTVYQVLAQNRIFFGPPFGFLGPSVNARILGISGGVVVSGSGGSDSSTFSIGETTWCNHSSYNPTFPDPPGPAFNETVNFIWIPNT